MDNKGYTLLEVIMSITILSIASLMLFTGFMSILNFMEKSNMVKNASNALLSYAEGDATEEVKKKVQMDIAPVTYTIKSDLDTDIKVNTKKGILTPSDGTDIILRNLSNSYLRLLSSYDEYKTGNKLSVDLFNICMGYVDSEFYDGISYNDILKQILDGKPLGNQKWDVFASNLLIEEYRSQTFIAPIFPFEKNLGNITNGDLLIYLSSGDATYKFNESFRDPLHYFYNYDKQSKQGDWYFTDSNKYQLKYSDEVNSVALFVTNNGVEERFNSYTEFIASVKGSSKAEWKKLNGNAEFDGKDSSNIWLES